jgi:L,D-transpeptidase catalytic domain
MKKLLTCTLLSILPMTTLYANNAGNYFGEALCEHPNYNCIKVTRGQSWKQLFPNPHHRDIVQRVNRTYNYIYRGRKLAVPKDIDNVTIFDVSPFSLNINQKGEKIIIIDQNKLAWGAYDRKGRLLKWGPISSGKDYCPDIGRRCRTQTGVFRFFDKQNKKCRSRMFRANMPFCMFFYKGFALHGSDDIPGKRASHGCIRLFVHDAKWLNHKFVEVSHKTNNFRGTKVVVQKLDHKNPVKYGKKKRRHRRR